MSALGQEQTIGATRGAYSAAAISQGFMPECLAQAYAAERQCGKLRSVRRSQNSRWFAEQPPGKTLRQRQGYKAGNTLRRYRGRKEYCALAGGRPSLPPIRTARVSRRNSSAKPAAV